MGLFDNNGALSKLANLRKYNLRESNMIKSTDITKVGVQHIGKVTLSIVYLGISPTIGRCKHPTTSFVLDTITKDCNVNLSKLVNDMDRVEYISTGHGTPGLIMKSEYVVSGKLYEMTVTERTHEDSTLTKYTNQEGIVHDILKSIAEHSVDLDIPVGELVYKIQRATIQDIAQYRGLRRTDFFDKYCVDGVKLIGSKEYSAVFENKNLTRYIVSVRPGESGDKTFPKKVSNELENPNYAELAKLMGVVDGEPVLADGVIFELLSTVDLSGASLDNDMRNIQYKSSNVFINKTPIVMKAIRSLMTHGLVVYAFKCGNEDVSYFCSFNDTDVTIVATLHPLMPKLSDVVVSVILEAEDNMDEQLQQWLDALNKDKNVTDEETTYKDQVGNVLPPRVVIDDNYTIRSCHTTPTGAAIAYNIANCIKEDITPMYIATPTRGYDITKLSKGAPTSASVVSEHAAHLSVALSELVALERIIYTSATTFIVVVNGSYYQIKF